MAAPDAPGTEKPAKAKKEKVEKVPRKSRFAELYPDTAKVVLLVKENPKKKGSKSFDRFNGYFGAATVADAVKKGVTYADIAYDVGHGFVKIG